MINPFKSKKGLGRGLSSLIGDNDISVVNVIGIEKYLSSVVGSEMPAKWPLEALKAQACIKNLCFEAKGQFPISY